MSIATLAEKSTEELSPLLLTTRQAAKALGVSERLLYDLRDGGEIRCVRHGKHKDPTPGTPDRRKVFYHPEDLQAYVNSKRT